MKNALILAGMLVMALTGCGEKKVEQAAPAPEAAPAAVSAAVSAAAPETEAVSAATSAAEATK